MKNVYFLGIGGIGMSALARYYKFRGCSVSGYDRTSTPLTRELEKEGIGVHYEPDVSKIPSSRDDTLVVYTPAIPEDMPEMVAVREGGYRIVKRSQVLGEVTHGQCCLAVAGTHGKTTTSTLIAHILTQSGEGCSAFLGGISKNYGTNLLVSASPVAVVEADEFDRSFLCLQPSITAITAMDADHLDVYGDLETMQDAYRQYASQVVETIILKHGLPVSQREVSAKIFTYSLDNSDATFYAQNVIVAPDGHCSFDLVYPGGVLEGIRVGTLGRLNVENSIAAAALCLCHGVDAQKVKEAISTFRGVKRRLDEHVNGKAAVYIDDYAHHPAEIKASLSSIREMFPSRKLTVVFQPHLYTRTRDFAPGFAEALSVADRLILLPIYPARELPIEGVDSNLILSMARCPQKEIVPYESLIQTLSKTFDSGVLVTLGAGNIDRFIEPITEMLSSR